MNAVAVNQELVYKALESRKYVTNHWQHFRMPASAENYASDDSNTGIYYNLWVFLYMEHVDFNPKNTTIQKFQIIWYTSKGVHLRFDIKKKLCISILQAERVLLSKEKTSGIVYNIMSNSRFIQQEIVHECHRNSSRVSFWRMSYHKTINGGMSCWVISKETVVIWNKQWI